MKKVETEEEKVKRFERVIEKLKKMLDFERRQLKQSRSQYQVEMSSKTELEHLLRETVEQVKNEKKKKVVSKNVTFMNNEDSNELN